MKNVSKVRLSLRKLLIAAMAVGPLAVLPGPVWAVLPTNSSFTVTNPGGTANVVQFTTTLANIEVSDRAVLVWNDNAFNINLGDTWNFDLPSGGAVLNKVGYATNGTLATPDDAIITGTLQSDGRVFILANGNISVASGAVINTTGGLVLSTLQDSEAAFRTTGNLLNTGAALGNITLSDPLNVTGGLAAYTGSFDGNAVGGGSVSGNLILRAVTADAGIALATGSDLTITGGGNLTVTTSNGAITQANDIIMSPANRTATFNTGTTGTAGVTLTAANNDFGTVAITTNGSASVTDANALILGASTIGDDLTVVTTTGNITTSGAVVVTDDASFTSSASGLINIANNSSVGGDITASTANGNITFNGVGNVTAGALTSGTGLISVTSNGTIRFNGVITSTANITATGATINHTAGATINGANVVTFNGTSGNVSLGAITANRVAITSNNGTINQSAALVTTAVTGVNSFNAGSAGNVVLTNSANNLHFGTSLNITASTANVITGNSVNVGTSNITNGNFTIDTNVANQNVVLGGAGVGSAAGNINVAGVLNVITSGTGTIEDNDYSAFNVLGGLNLETENGDITLDAATKNGVLAPLVSFGEVMLTSVLGSATVHESTTLNLGDVDVVNLAARSVNGGIIDSGDLDVSGTANFTVSTGNSVTLDGTDNEVGTINFIGGTDHSFLADSPVILGSATAVAGNVTVASQGSNGITLNGPQVTGSLVVDSGGAILIGQSTTVTGDLTLIADATGASSITQTVGTALKVTGNTSITSGGNVTLGDATTFSEANDFNSVVFNGTGGDATISDINNLSVSGNVSGVLTAVAGNDSSIVNAYTLTLGDLMLGGLDARAENGVAATNSGPSGAITQAAGTKISSFGNVNFLTNNAAITVNNSGNSFGGVSANAGNSTINIMEDATLRILGITSSGNVTLTSQFGSIIETAAGANTLSGNVVTLNAPNGSIMVGGTTLTTGSTAGTANTIVANAPNGSIAVQSTTANLVLGNVTGLSLTVSHTGNGNLTQSGRANVFGTSSVTSGGNIALTNAANNFGRVTLNATTINKNVSITEASTLNLGNVVMASGTNGTFTATSVNGDIVDTGLLGVKLGGVVGGLGTGIITLNATNGNITLDDPTTDFNSSAGVVFTGNNVVLAPLNAIVLGAANLTATANTLNVTSATGTITDNGNVVVTGDAIFQTGAQNIVLNSTGNRFGAVRFAGNQVTITQANDINIITGSTAIDDATLTSGSYITIDNRGGTVTLGGAAEMTAQGSIVLPKLIQIADTLTVISDNLKDLSALSITGDLAGKAPIDLGTGTYLPPQP